MKKLLFILSLLLTSKTAFTQEPTKLVLSYASGRNDIDGDGKWSDWSSPVEVDIICIIDWKNNKITTIGNYIDVFKITKFYDEEILENGQRTMSFDCTFESGEKLKVKLVKLADDKGTRLYFIEQTIDRCYYVKKVA